MILKMESKLKAYKPERVFKFLLSFVILLIVLLICITSGASQQFSLLSKAFLHGQLNFLKPIGGVGQDPIFWHGKIYWGDGPLPALLLLPFTAVFSIFHMFFYQNYIDWAFVIGVLFLVFKLARSFLNYSTEDSLILSLGFTLGSVFIGVASVPSSWSFAQVITTFLIFWSLYVYFVKKQQQWRLLGIICGMIALTRITALPLLIFFLLEIPRSEASHLRFKALAQLVSPVAVSIVLIALYNFLRFQSPFDGGFTHQLLHSDSAESRALGEFGLIHIPTNFYSAVLRAPVPVLRDSTSWTLKFPYIQNNVYGMSIFITSPYLLSLFFSKWSYFDSRTRNLLIATCASALLVFSFFGIGVTQYGYRYELDFLPELFLLFMIIYRKNHDHLSSGMKFVLLASGIFNFYLLISYLAL
jgi:hypothetical protein